MERMELKFHVKAVSEEAGTFEGLAATYDNVDRGGDKIERGAFTKTLKDNGGSVPLFLQHGWKREELPIGVAALQDTLEGLATKGELVLESADARITYALLKKKALRGLSIGYEIVRDQIAGGVRHLKELKLIEVSVVGVPMNERAIVAAVKSEAETFDASLKAQIEGMFAKACREIERKPQWR
jgi:HK97 family phage prohead protease